MTTTAAVAVPDWLALHAGTIAPGMHPETRYVMIGGQPLYKLDVRPAAGKYACAVASTVSGKRLDDRTQTYPSQHEAFAGGLGQLRDQLGW